MRCDPKAVHMTADMALYVRSTVSTDLQFSSWHGSPMNVTSSVIFSVHTQWSSPAPIQTPTSAKFIVLSLQYSMRWTASLSSSLLYFHFCHCHENAFSLWLLKSFLHWCLLSSFTVALTIFHGTVLFFYCVSISMNLWLMFRVGPVFHTVVMPMLSTWSTPWST